MASVHSPDITPVRSPEVSALLGEESISQSESQAALASTTHALEYQEQWVYALREVYAQRDQLDIERGLREEGDLAQLKDYYQKTRRAPPPELELALRLDDLLEALAHHWPLLSTAERTQLSNKWSALEAIDLSSIASKL